MNSRSCFILITFFFLSNCEREKFQVYTEEFEPYVNEFFAQARIRGHELHATDFNFTIQFGETSDGEIFGTCDYRNDVITINSTLWEHRDIRQREWLIFHELGHCILNRDHKNVKSGSGECLSYMIGDENDFDCSINLYSDYWREYFLDELFDVSTHLPKWYLMNSEYNFSVSDYTFSLVVADTLVELLEIDTLNFIHHDEFVLEIDFNNHHTSDNTVYMRIGNLGFSYCTSCTQTNSILRINNLKLYSRGYPNIESNTKLSVVRNEDVVTFFVNKTFIHAMEFSIIEGSGLRTNIFDSPMEISINYLYN